MTANRPQSARDRALLAPFAGLRATPESAASVAAPPYDVLSTEEARARARGRPRSFLHVSRPEIDLPPDQAGDPPAVYRAGAAAFRRLRDEGALLADPGPRLYAYRMETPERSQTGLVAAASVAAYETGAIRRHELTRPAKEDDRVRHMEALGAQTGPVFLLHRPDEDARRLIGAATTGAPALRATLDGTIHSIWVIDGMSRITALCAAFDRLGTLYIADGHHRAAAAARVAATRAGAAGRFLVVTFPADEVRILGYHRVVRDLNGLDRAAFLERLDASFRCTPSDGPVMPERRGVFGLYLGGRWFSLTPREAPARADPAAARLDVAILSALVLEPILGISDPREDPRIDFVGGDRGAAALVERVDRGEAALAVSLFPPTVDDLMDVADGGGIMPPKSTWFEPKLADGLISHLID